MDDNQIALPADAPLAHGYNVEFAIAAWLDAKQGKSNSAKTRKAYEGTIADYRQVLQRAGLDLDSTNYQAMTLATQAWCKSSKRGKTVSAATINQRLAIMSSFFDYAAKHNLLPGINPVIKVERARVQQYASAQPLDAETVKARMKAIDRADTIGKRDYAILSVALSTGRRLHEIANLRWADMQIGGDNHITLTFTTKGAKILRDRLAPPVGRVLLDYLYTIYGTAAISQGTLSPESPIWVSTSKRNTGAAVGWQTIRKICEEHLGTSKVHALRHTFAHSMEKANAKPTEIQRRLGHSSLHTTSIYLDALSSAENEYADVLCDMFGIGD